MELKRHASYWMDWKRWEHLNGKERDWEDLIRLIITILILIISILSYLEVKKHHYGWDTVDFNDNVRKDFNYG